MIAEMMLLLKLVYQLGFATAVLGWNHASRKKFDEVVGKNEIVLVACEFLPPSDRTGGSWKFARMLMTSQLSR